MLLDFNYYLILPHHYAINDIHYILLTPLEKGIVYVLPSRGYGFDAVYCPQLELEQAVLELARPWCEPPSARLSWPARSRSSGTRRSPTTSPTGCTGTGATPSLLSAIPQCLPPQTTRRPTPRRRVPSPKRALRQNYIRIRLLEMPWKWPVSWDIIICGLTGIVSPKTMSNEDTHKSRG